MAIKEFGLDKKTQEEHGKKCLVRFEPSGLKIEADVCRGRPEG